MYPRNKCDILFMIFQNNCAKQLGLDGKFKESPVWITGDLSRTGNIYAVIHKEVMDITDKEYVNMMEDWRKDFHPKIEKCNILFSCIPNSNQTGLYYTKIPN